MDPVILGIIASVVTILTFVYMLLFGQRALLDLLQERRERAAQRDESPTGTAGLPSLPEESPGLDGAPPAPATALPSTPGETATISSPMTSSPRLPTHEARTLAPDQDLREILTLVMRGEEPRRVLEQAVEDRYTQDLLSEIVRDMEDGNCVFLLGAGISIAAGMPGGADLARLLTRRAGWDGDLDRSLPEVAQRYINRGRGVEMRNLLQRAVKDRQVRPTLAHHALARMAQSGDVILTTNWDRLLEDALADAGQVYRAIFLDEEASHLEARMINVLKLHGDVEAPSSYIVAQKDDIEQYALKRPSLLRLLDAHLTTSTLVIVGSRLHDTDIEAVYDEVHRRLGSGAHQRPLYVVVPRPDGDEARYWQRKGAQFIEMTADRFMLLVYYLTTDFANREEEVSLGSEWGIPVGRPVLEFCGMPGIGKTTLLRRIAWEQRRRPGVDRVAFIDFQQVVRGSKDFQQAQRAIEAALAAKLGLDESATAEEIVTSVKGQRVALFFDSVEPEHRQVVTWIGKAFVARLPNLRVGFGCRRSVVPQAWRHNWQLKCKVYSTTLEAFSSLEAVQRQMAHRLFWSPDLAEQVFRLTGGHPGLVEGVMDWLGERAEGTIPVSLDEGELGEHLDTLINQRILQHVRRELWDALKLLAHFRGVGVEELAALAEAASGCDWLPSCLRDQTWSGLDQLLRRDLVGTALVEWRGDRQKYVTAEPVRTLLLSSGQVAHPERFAQISQIVGQIYSRWVSETRENIVLYLTELLYQLVKGSTVDPAIDPAAALQAGLERIAALRPPAVARGRLEDLQQTLEQDDDLEELAPAVYEDLLARVKAAIDNLEGTET